jgi:hypothetical protein
MHHFNENPGANAHFTILDADINAKVKETVNRVLQYAMIEVLEHRFCSPSCSKQRNFKRLSMSSVSIARLGRCCMPITSPLPLRL